MDTIKDRTILLIEDNPDDVELIIRSLQKHNIPNDPIIARDGQQALDFLSGTGEFNGRDLSLMPALILLDLKMPKIDGLEVLQRLRADERTEQLPVVIFSSSDEKRDLIDGYKMGANSYVRKPVDYIKLGETVRQLGTYWLLLNEPPPR